MTAQTTPTTGRRRWLLGIDFGTTYTCAAVREDGQVRELRIDGHARLSSAVFLEETGELRVGAAAESRAPLAPERFERTPKRYLEVAERGILLGDSFLEIADVVAAVLRVVWDEALLQHEGEEPEEVRLTHPASWGRDRCALLVEAAGRAGIKEPVLVPEPEAAAVFLARDGDGAALGQGSLTMVFDLGGGTFDTSILRRTGNRFRTVGEVSGHSWLGGERFDHLLYEDLGTQGLDPEAWQQLQTSLDRAWTRANFEFLRNVREAKEAVSRAATQPLLVPAPVSQELSVTRDQVERLIRDDIEQALDIAEQTLARAGVAAEQLSAVYLVGGSSRIPLVLHMVRQRFGRADFKDDPKTVVARGAVAFDSALVTETRAADPKPQSRRPWWALPAGVTGAVVAVVLLLVVVLGGAKTASGHVYDSQGHPIANLPITVTAYTAGGSKQWHVKTDGDGRFEIHVDAEKLQVGNWSVEAEFPYRGGTWVRSLVPVDDSGEWSDTHKLDFEARIAGPKPHGEEGSYGQEVIVADSNAMGSSEPPPESAAGYYGPDSTVTVVFTPAGPMVDGTEAKPFTVNFRLGDVGGGQRISDVPAGPWTVSGYVTTPDGQRYPVAFQPVEGQPSQTVLVTFGEDYKVVSLELVPAS